MGNTVMGLTVKFHTHLNQFYFVYSFCLMKECYVI